MRLNQTCPHLTWGFQCQGAAAVHVLPLTLSPATPPLVLFPSLSFIYLLAVVRDSKSTNTGLFWYPSSLVSGEHLIPLLFQLCCVCFGLYPGMLLPPALEKGLRFHCWCWGPQGLAARVTQEGSREREEWRVERENIVWGGALLFLNSQSSAHVTDGCHQQRVLGKER